MRPMTRKSLGRFRFWQQRSHPDMSRTFYHSSTALVAEDHPAHGWTERRSPIRRLDAQQTRPILAVWEKNWYQIPQLGRPSNQLGSASSETWKWAHVANLTLA